MLWENPILPEASPTSSYLESPRQCLYPTSKIKFDCSHPTGISFLSSMRGSREIWALDNLNINISPLYTIDTVKAAQHPLQLSFRCSLEKILNELSIPFAALHVAGNDAHFVLRALLMLAVRDAQRQLAALPAWISNSRVVAQAPRPFTKAEIEAMAQKTELEGREEQKTNEE